MIPNKIVNSDYGLMIINANDQGIGGHIDAYGYWARDDINLIINIIELILTVKPAVSYYDIGANIGTHSVAVAKTFGDRIKVRSFEAQRQVYYVLCGNIAINGLDNVHAHHLAMSNKSGQMIDIELPDYTVPTNFGALELMGSDRSDNQHMTKNKTETVETVCIDDFDEPVDFIKMDIEGMEHFALQGGKKTIAKHRPICFVEMWKCDTEAVVKFFKKLNYVAYQVKPDDWMFFPQESNFCVNGATKIEL